MNEPQSGSTLLPFFESAPQSEGMRMLMKVARRHQACVERSLGDRDMHHGQHRLLLQLVRSPLPLSQKELADQMCVSPAAVTTLLKKLEKEGYVSRAVTDSDNRRNDIRLTDSGRAKIEECRDLFESINRTMFEGLSEEDLLIFSRLVQHMDRQLDMLDAPDPCARRHHT